MDEEKKQEKEEGEGGKSKKKKITISINKKHYQVEEGVMSREEFIVLSQLPNDYQVWQIVGKADPEGEIPVNDIQVTESVQVKDGEKFRVVPPGTFGSC